MDNQMIQHTVVFRLVHTSGSSAETKFLKKAKALGELPNVVNLQVLKQVSKKNNYTFGLSMFFESESAYQAYNNHPHHIDFVNNVWLPEVAEFMEIDYVDVQP